MSDEQPKKSDARVDSEAETVVPGNSEAAKVAVPKIDLSDLFGPATEPADSAPMDDDKTPLPSREIILEVKAAGIESSPAIELPPEIEPPPEEAPTAVGTPLETEAATAVGIPLEIESPPEAYPVAPSSNPIASAIKVAVNAGPVITKPTSDEVSVSTPSFARGGAGDQVNVMNLPNPNTPKPEEPKPPENEQEAQTQIVGKAADPSIFESATVIRTGNDMSMSEVTRYLKDLKGKSLLHEDRPNITPFGEAPQFERRSSSRRTDSSRKGGRRGSDTSTGDLFSLGKKGPPPYVIGMGVAAVIVIIFAVSSFRSSPVKKIEKASVAKVVDDDEVVISEGPVTAQLKVEFLSDLHKNIETTKAHAPAY
jgi:hypothetical protein